MANPAGIGYESQILNAQEEKVIENLSEAIMIHGMPTHGDMINDPVFPFTSVFDFVKYWEIVFEDIGKEISYEKRYAISPMWGALTSLSCFLGGIRFIQKKYGDRPLPNQVEKAFADFRDLLINEANETGSGTQKFVSERWERFQK